MQIGNNLTIGYELLPTDPEVTGEARDREVMKYFKALVMTVNRVGRLPVMQFRKFKK